MDKNEYGQGFLYAEDLLRGGEFLAIEVEIEEAIPPNTIKAGNGAVIDKWTLRFKGKQKQWCVGKTAEKVVHSITGEPAGPGWVGKKLRLEARFVRFGSEEIVAIRAIPPTGTRLRKKLIEHLGKPAVWTVGK